MKRRSAECGKLRRPLKRSKIGEGLYGSILTYIKFFLVWTLVLMADFILDFRFEYLWPLWLAIRSVYDSFKYQGVAFSIFFVCVTLTSDVACYLFIPVQWLFFTASTYVWVQYVWQTERGICLPTILLWLIFLYIEVAIRLRDLKNSPFQLDLCRPFAAHCVGYPVITMGFSFKSCISYRFQLRKQKEVEKANRFYFELLEQALPPEVVQNNKQKALVATDDVLVNGNGVAGTSATGDSLSLQPVPVSKLRTDTNGGGSWLSSMTGSAVSFDASNHDLEFLERPVNDLDDDDSDDESSTTAGSGVAGGSGDSSLRSNGSAVKLSSAGRSSKDATKRSGKSSTSGSTSTSATATVSGKDPASSLSKLEADIKRLKADLQSSRCTEQELRSQINSLSISERSAKTELTQLRQENDSLQAKVQRGTASRQQDKQNLAILERRLQEERKQRTTLEQQLAVALAAEKQRRKTIDDASAVTAAATAAAAAAAATAPPVPPAVPAAATARVAPRSNECTSEQCKNRRWELDNEMKQLRRELQIRDDRLRQLEHETQMEESSFKTALQQKRGESQSETEVLMSALGAIQDKNAHLETSLSAETRLKLDLFSALGEAKRQIEIQQGVIYQKELELAELKSKVAEVMSFLPSVTLTGYSPMRYSPSYVGVSGSGGTLQTMSTVALDSTVGGGANADQSLGGGVGVSAGATAIAGVSTLNPAACDFQLPNKIAQ